MNLRQILVNWLREEFPNWEVTRDAITSNGEELRWIRFKPLHREQVWLYEDRVVFDDDKEEHKYTVYAHDPRFLELLWNRLYTMESGFQRAMATRDFHRPESK